LLHYKANSLALCQWAEASTSSRSVIEEDGKGVKRILPRGDTNEELRSQEGKCSKMICSLL
jgi:hypothetical protein